MLTGSLVYVYVRRFFLKIIHLYITDEDEDDDVDLGCDISISMRINFNRLPNFLICIFLGYLLSIVLRDEFGLKLSFAVPISLFFVRFRVCFFRSMLLINCVSLTVLTQTHFFFVRFYFSFFRSKLLINCVPLYLHTYTHTHTHTHTQIVQLQRRGLL